MSEPIKWTNVTLKLSQLKKWDNNPAEISKEAAGRLVECFNEFGQIETLAVDPENRLVDGHQRLDTWLAKYGDIEVDCRKASRLLTEKERQKIAVMLRSGAVGRYNWDVVSGWDSKEVIDWIGEDTVKDWKRDITAVGMMLNAEKEPKEEDPEEKIVYRVPDAIWGTDNDYGIPLLDTNMQAPCLEAPFVGWGTTSRKNKMTGTYHFYVDDYRFENIWKHPEDIVNSACNSFVEPNFSVYDDMPKAIAIYQVYRKRWVARWLQSLGLTCFVDLNISHRHTDLRFIGVPKGWKSYCTRAYGDRLEETKLEFEQAKAHAESDILFVCYGGGKKAEALSKENGWIWYPDQETKLTQI